MYDSAGTHHALVSFMKTTTTEKKMTIMNAIAIALGTTVDQGSVRIHRYTDSFAITCLLSAGKRGKRCDTLNLSLTSAYRRDVAEWMDRMAAALATYTTFADVLALVTDLYAMYPSDVSMRLGASRGIDVAPMAEVHLTGCTWRLTASSTEFHLVNSVRFNPDAANDGKELRQDTAHWSRSKKDAAKFHGWLTTNMASVETMTMSDFFAVWRDLGIRFETH